MKINFYPIDFQYKLKDDKALVHMYSKLEDGTKVCVIIEHEPYFYAKAKDEAFLKERFATIKVDIRGQTGRITHWEEVERELLGKGEKFLKVFTNFPTAVQPISKELENLGIKTYEKDIIFTQRFIRDSGLLPLQLAEAEGEFVKTSMLRVPTFMATNIVHKPVENLTNSKILSIDIETYAARKGVNPELNPILMIAFSGINEKEETYKKVLTWKSFPNKLDYLEILESEESMLKRFREIILSYQPDIITGYFTDGFDFPYIKTRADKFKVKLDLGLDYSDLDAGSNRREAKIKGMLHLDVFKFVRNIFGKNLKTASFSLDEVSNELLGTRKHNVDVSKLYLSWDKNEGLEEYCIYNLQDAELTLQLCQKLFFDMVEFAQICGLPVFDVIRMSFSRLVESYIMKRAMEFNVMAPNRPDNQETTQRMEETYEGGFVYEPTPGLYKDIVVFDFRSLYPTIITSHNIGPEGFRCSCCNEKVPDFEDYWYCSKEKKFIPTILQDIIEKRSDLKRAMKKLSTDTGVLESRSYALKILANSFYGYLGFFGARWYCMPCARSTTAYARNYIKETIKKAEKKGFKVCYGDTDSLFVLLGESNLIKAKEFMNEINLDLPGRMELEFEGHFSRGLFVGLKSSDKGAKKKYALLAQDGSMKITGFETVRSNWSEISKEVQEKVLRFVLEEKNDEAVSYVKEVVDKLKEGKIDSKKLIIRTKITRDLDSYSSIGPHVAVAKRMVKKGEVVSPGTIVEYIITKGSGLIRERAKLVEEADGYDYEYYLNNQIIPAVSSIFAVFGYSEDDLFAETSQKGLGDYFS